jgi:hypothetical protein
MKEVKKMGKILSILTGLCLLAGSVVLTAGTTNTNVMVWATATVQSSPMGLSVSVINPGRVNGVDFGSVRATLGNIRFQATNHASVNYFPGSNPVWYLVVYSQNLAGKTNDMGLMNGAVSPTNFAPLKTWCGNYGPVGFGSGNNPPYAASQNDAYLWGGLDLNGNGNKNDVMTTGTYSEAVWNADFNGDGDKTDIWDTAVNGPLAEAGAGWNWVWDYDMAMSNPSLTKRILCSKVGTQDNSLPSPFNAFFAMEAAGMKSGLYNTKLTFELDTTAK